MLRTHLKFATRVFLKDKFFSILNILGLALGIAVSIILLLILQNDLTYDRYHTLHNRIYRLGGHLQATGLEFRGSRSARELGEILREEFPEVQNVVRANSWDRTLVKYVDAKGVEKAFYEENIVRTDSTYFQVFTHQFISGDPKTCLTQLNTLVVTQSTAKRYFGDDDPLDKSVTIDGSLWKVTGVIKDVPENTHLKFDILLSRLVDREWVRENGQIKSEAFWNPDVYTYLLMPENYDTKDFYDKFPKIFDKYYKSFGDKVGGKYTPILERLADIHFYSDLDSDEPHGNLAYVYAFTGIGIFIIILACINYMNLSTAKSVTRAGEIAMKKTLGSAKSALSLSFLTESIFLAVISLIVAIALVIFVLEATSFNQLIGKNLKPDFMHNPVLVIGTLAITLGIGIISGLYPAFYLPNIPTIQALKGSYKNRRSSHMLRRVLITTQFAISIFVVVCTIFMKDQINFVRNKELGFNKENIVLLPIQDTLVQKQIGGIKSQFLQDRNITAATTSYSVPGLNVNGGSVMWAEGPEGMKQQSFTLMFVGDDYLKTMGIELVDGRDFLLGPKADIEDVFIVNEAAAKLMGWADKAIGKKVKFFHAEKDGQVIGVVKDFNFNSLHNAIEPLLIVKAREEGGFLHLKVKSENLTETMDQIKKQWMKYDPNHPYEYFFLDQKFNEQYKDDEIQHALLSNLSYICIFISLLGLLGLSAFTAAQRTKEIGVRKVHGASIPQIIFLLYKDVMYLIVIASLIIIPVSYMMITQWMGNFAYRTEINYLTFGIVAILALLFAFFTVAFHSLKTARTNPVDSLKYE
ncbi:MAG TPA: ABC transporter permease [Chryseolinea sp.]|nr:ABC transporter permease [Chryseolinea sp.]